MKSTSIAVVMAMSFSAFAQEPLPVDLIIFAGQSNAMGRKGDAAQYPPDTDGLDAQIPFYWVTPQFGFSSDGWQTIQPQPGHFPAGHFGPEITFARELKRRGMNVAVFKFSQGATSLHQNWKRPGDGGLYDQMVGHIHRAKALFEAEGKTVRFAGLIWIQGESDAVEEHAGLYGKRLKELVEDLRDQVTGTPDLPVVLGLDEEHPWVRKFPQVIAAQEKLASEDPHIARSSMRGLEKADVSHLKPAAVAEHGQRLFETWNGLHD